MPTQEYLQNKYLIMLWTLRWPPIEISWYNTNKSALSAASFIIKKKLLHYCVFSIHLTIIVNKVSLLLCLCIIKLFLLLHISASISLSLQNSLEYTLLPQFRKTAAIIGNLERATSTLFITRYILYNSIRLLQ